MDPNFDQNGYVYVSFVTPDRLQRVSRFTVTNPTATVLTINPASEFVLVQGDQTAADDHLGGEMRFGADGKLYIAIGDNGWFNGSTEISNNAQDLTNIYGKVLRISFDGTVPTDNPFYNTPGAVKSIYTYGLRNFFRGGVTPNGQMLVGDVGQATWEEIDLIAAGANYGWPSAEGVCPSPGVCTAPGDFVNPAYAYAHNGSSSISSVLVYNGSSFGPAWKNTVFFADFRNGSRRSPAPTASHRVAMSNCSWPASGAPPACWSDRTATSTSSPWTARSRASPRRVGDRRSDRTTSPGRGGGTGKHRSNRR